MSLEKSIIDGIRQHLKEIADEEIEEAVVRMNARMGEAISKMPITLDRCNLGHTGEVEFRARISGSTLQRRTI